MILLLMQRWYKGGRTRPRPALFYQSNVNAELQDQVDGRPSSGIVQPKQFRLVLKCQNSAFYFNREGEWSRLLSRGQFKPETFFIISIVLRACTSWNQRRLVRAFFCYYHYYYYPVRPAIVTKECLRMFIGIVLWTQKVTKLRTLVQREPTTAKRSQYCHVSYFQPGHHISFRWHWQQPSRQ